MKKPPTKLGMRFTDLLPQSGLSQLGRRVYHLPGENSLIDPVHP